MMSSAQALRAVLARWRVPIGALCALLCALWCANVLLETIPASRGIPYEQTPVTREARAVLMKSPPPRKLTDDDSVRVLQGFTTKPTFASTFRYWTGSWVQSELGPPTPFGPYYRPLTSQLWWLEQYFGGPNSLSLFLTVHLLWHIAFTLALWATLRLWWNDTGTLLCLFIWCVGLPRLLSDYAAPFDALNMWKDDPEMAVGLCILGAMAATRAFVLTGKKYFVVLGLLAFAFSLSFKETGYITPFFVTFALWRFEALKKHWRLVPLFFGAAVLAVAYRTWALHGLGGYHGTNGSWLPRAFAELLGGSITVAVLAGNSLTVAVAALTLALWHWFVDKRKIALFWLGVMVLACVWAQYNNPVPDQTVLIQLCDVSTENRIYKLWPFTLLTLSFWQLFVIKRPRAMVWGWIWCLLAYLPLLKQAVTGHGFYFFSVGWALWMAGGLVAMSREFQDVWPRLWSRIGSGRALQTKPS